MKKFRSIVFLILTLCLSAYGENGDDRFEKARKKTMILPAVKGQLLKDPHEEINEIENQWEKSTDEAEKINWAEKAYRLNEKELAGKIISTLQTKRLINDFSDLRFALEHASENFWSKPENWEDWNYQGKSQTLFGLSIVFPGKLTEIKNKMSVALQWDEYKKLHADAVFIFIDMNWKNSFENTRMEMVGFLFKNSKYEKAKKLMETIEFNLQNVSSTVNADKKFEPRGFDVSMEKNRSYYPDANSNHELSLSPVLIEEKQWRAFVSYIEQTTKDQVIKQYEEWLKTELPGFAALLKDYRPEIYQDSGGYFRTVLERLVNLSLEPNALAYIKHNGRVNLFAIKKNIFKRDVISLSRSFFSKHNPEKYMYYYYNPTQEIEQLYEKLVQTNVLGDLNLMEVKQKLKAFLMTNPQGRPKGFLVGVGVSVENASILRQWVMEKNKEKIRWFFKSNPNGSYRISNRIQSNYDNGGYLTVGGFSEGFRAWKAWWKRTFGREENNAHTSGPIEEDLSITPAKTVVKSLKSNQYTQQLKALKILDDPTQFTNDERHWMLEEVSKLSLKKTDLEEVKAKIVTFTDDEWKQELEFYGYNLAPTLDGVTGLSEDIEVVRMRLLTRLKQLGEKVPEQSEALNDRFNLHHVLPFLTPVAMFQMKKLPLNALESLYALVSQIKSEPLKNELNWRLFGGLVEKERFQSLSRFKSDLTMREYLLGVGGGVGGGLGGGVGGGGVGGVVGSFVGSVVGGEVGGEVGGVVGSFVGSVVGGGLGGIVGGGLGDAKEMRILSGSFLGGFGGGIVGGVFGAVTGDPWLSAEVGGGASALISSGVMLWPELVSFVRWNKDKDKNLKALQLEFIEQHWENTTEQGRILMAQYLSNLQSKETNPLFEDIKKSITDPKLLNQLKPVVSLNPTEVEFNYVDEEIDWKTLNLKTPKEKLQYIFNTWEQASDAEKRRMVNFLMNQKIKETDLALDIMNSMVDVKEIKGIEDTKFVLKNILESKFAEPAFWQGWNYKGKTVSLLELANHIYDLKINDRIIKNLKHANVADVLEPFNSAHAYDKKRNGLFSAVSRFLVEVSYRKENATSKQIQPEPELDLKNNPVANKEKQEEEKIILSPGMQDNRKNVDDSEKTLRMMSKRGQTYGANKDFIGAPNRAPTINGVRGETVLERGFYSRPFAPMDLTGALLPLPKAALDRQVAVSKKITHPMLKVVSRWILVWNALYLPSSAQAHKLITDAKSLQQHLRVVDKEAFMLKLDEAFEQSAKQGQELRFEDLSGIQKVKEDFVVIHPWLRAKLQAGPKTTQNTKPLVRQPFFEKEWLKSRKHTLRKGK